MATKTETPEQTRLATILALSDAFAAQLRITARMRPAQVRAMLAGPAANTRPAIAKAG